MPNVKTGIKKKADCTGLIAQCMLRRQRQKGVVIAVKVSTQKEYLALEFIRHITIEIRGWPRIARP